MRDGGAGVLLEYVERLAWDPTAPVPAGWPHGWQGALLLFCIPGGVGIPPGVLLGQGDGVGPLALTSLYFLSDVILALAFEPLLVAARALARRVPRVARGSRVVLRAVERTVAASGLPAPAGIVLAGFGAGLPFGRALAAAAGRRLVPGWLLTIAGDMLYFLLGMLSTRWFAGLLGDQRTAVLASLAVMLVVPALVRRWRPGAG